MGQCLECVKSMQNKLFINDSCDDEFIRRCNPDDYDAEFINACEYGYIYIAKKLYSLGADISYHDNFAFKRACSSGHLNIAQWLQSLGVNCYSSALVYTCYYGKLNVMKWLHNEGADISYVNNKALEVACSHGYFDIVQWLHSLGANSDEAFIEACRFGRIDIVEWFIDIHYKYGGYVKFYCYETFSNKIKNILINNNLVNPSELSLEELKYYLARTGNIVPADFILKYDNVEVKYRGKHTKTAPRE
jgi:ankyrin repeat protein